MSSRLEWQEGYLTGIEEIDSQHKALFDLVLSLGEALRGKAPHMDLGSLVSRLESYANEHLASEEALFSKYGYPGTKEHLEAHNMLREDIARFKDMLEHDKLTALALSSYMELWLYNHVIKMDMDYRAFLIRRGVLKDRAPI